MNMPGLETEGAAQQLGAQGVENLVTNAERICTYKQQQIELTNQSAIVALQGQYQILVAEERRILELLPRMYGQAMIEPRLSGQFRGIRSRFGENE